MEPGECRRRHIVAVPLPLPSHVHACLSMARFLVSAGGFSFTFALTESLAATIKDDQTIRSATVPVQGWRVSKSFDLNIALTVMKSMRSGFEALLEKLVSSEDGVCCIMADSFVTWSQDVATSFSLPRYVFFVSNAHCLAVCLHTPTLIKERLAPVQDPSYLMNSIPGIFPFFARDLPAGIKVVPHMIVETIKDIHEAAGIILNTVYSWQRRPLDVIKEKLPVYPIGPSLLMSNLVNCPSGIEPGIWNEDESCLTWLDTLPPSSVLYVSFGSLATMRASQIVELAEGLEASGHPFLWVLRENMIKDYTKDLLPQEFWEKIRSRARVINWAPQLKVLAHAAVGGFLTHCGWNSIIENITEGCVPMICCPLIAEQRFNARLLIDEWKIGVELLQDDDGTVSKEELVRAVKELMSGDNRKELRNNILQLKHEAYSACQKGGSSHKYFEKLVQDIKNLCCRKPNEA